MLKSIVDLFNPFSGGNIADRIMTGNYDLGCRSRTRSYSMGYPEQEALIPKLIAERDAARAEAARLREIELAATYALHAIRADLSRSATNRTIGRAEYALRRAFGEQNTVAMARLDYHDEADVIRHLDEMRARAALSGGGESHGWEQGCGSR